MARKKDTGFVPEDDREDKKGKPLSDDEAAWGRRLVQSKAFQKKYSAKWENNKRLIFNSVQAGGAAPGEMPVGISNNENSIAYGWGLYEGLETTIYVQNPDVMVTCREPSKRLIAKNVTDIVRYDIDQMNVKDQGNLCLLDTFVNGYGVVTEDVKTYKKPEKDEDGKPYEKVENQDFEVRRVDPFDILFARDAKRLDLSDSRYLFTAWYPTIEELRNDPEITDLPDNIENFPEASEFTRRVAQPDGPVERQAATLVAGGASGEKDPDYRTICVWEVFDKVNHDKFYMTDFKHYIIGHSQWPVNLKFGCRDLFPATLLYQHPIPGRFYPMPEAELIAPQLSEMNVLESMISEDTRTKWRKYLTLAGILTADQKSQITDTTLKNALIFVDWTQLQEVLGIQGNATDFAQLDLRKLVVPMEDVSPKKDLFQRYDMLEKEIQHIVGYGPAARGGLPSTRSAREAMMINAEKERKLDKRKSRITDFYRLLAMKHVRFLQKYMSIERYAKIYPKVGELVEWLKYSREDITGDFEFDVLTGSSVPKTTEARKAAEKELFTAIMPIVQALGLDPRAPFYRLAEFNEWDGVDELFSGMNQEAEKAAMMMAGFKKGQVPPEQLVNQFAKLAMAVLGPAKTQALAKKLEGGQGGQGAPQQAEGSRGDPTPSKTAAGVL